MAKKKVSKPNVESAENASAAVTAGEAVAAPTDAFGGVIESRSQFDMDSRLSLRHNITAGLDVHKLQITVTVLWPDRAETRTYRNMKCDNKKLARWLSHCGVELAIMESTSIFWRSSHDHLRNHGVNVIVVNARHIKRFEGNKTDALDSKDLATLAKLDIMKASRIPDTEIDELRSMCRIRQNYVENLGDWKNRVVKLLTWAGFGVTQVVTDAFGTTGRIIIQGLLDGLDVDAILERIDKIVGYRLKAPREMLVEALEGKLTDVLKEQLTDMLDTIDHHIEKLASIDDRLEEHLVARGHGPELALLQTIPGVSKTAATTLLLELGCDVTDFASASKLASWAGMCPGNNESAGKRLSGRTTGGNRYIKRILCEIANAAVKAKCYYKEKFSTLRPRRGYRRAIVAIGHKILKTAYLMLINHEPYRDKSFDHQMEVTKRNMARWEKNIIRFKQTQAAKAAARTAG